MVPLLSPRQGQNTDVERGVFPMFLQHKHHPRQRLITTPQATNMGAFEGTPFCGFKGRPKGTPCVSNERRGASRPLIQDVLTERPVLPARREIARAG